MAYKIVSVIGTAGGGITDSLIASAAYNSVALAFSGTAGGVIARRIISTSFL